MRTEADRSFGEWSLSEYGPGRIHINDEVRIWHAAVAWATARERERAIAEAVAVQVGYERLAHNASPEHAGQHHAAAMAAIEIAAALRGANGGEGNG